MGPAEKQGRRVDGVGYQEDEDGVRKERNKNQCDSITPLGVFQCPSADGTVPESPLGLKGPGVTQHELKMRTDD